MFTADLGQLVLWNKEHETAANELIAQRWHNIASYLEFNNAKNPQQGSLIDAIRDIANIIAEPDPKDDKKVTIPIKTLETIVQNQKERKHQAHLIDAFHHLPDAADSLELFAWGVNEYFPQGLVRNYQRHSVLPP